MVANASPCQTSVRQEVSGRGCFKQRVGGSAQLFSGITFPSAGSPVQLVLSWWSQFLYLVLSQKKRDFLEEEDDVLVGAATCWVEVPQPLPHLLEIAL